MIKLILGIVLILSINMFAKEKVIAKIDEASGIAYSQSSNSLFVVNDEGTIYEITTKGKILRKKKIGKYDFEGVAIDEQNNLILLAVEGDDNILILDKKNLKIKKEISIKREYKGINLLKKSGDGIEGLALYKNKIYASNQSNKKYPKEDSSVIVILDYKLDKKKLKIKDIIKHGFTDISGLTFFKDKLYLISDKNNFIVKYDIKKNKILEKTKLPKRYAQEGIAFDKKENLYIADDNGQILKIKKWKK